jgi:recombination protein RecT
VNGAEKTIFMTVKQIENHEKKFRKGQYMGKGWRDDFDAMARKTVYRKLIGKWGVMSIEYQTHSEGVETADTIRNEFMDDAPVGTIDADFARVDADTGEVIENG